MGSAKKMDASGKIKWRVVIDYRKLNNVTVGDAYPVTNIADILDQLSHCKYFMTLDLASGFHQIEMNPEDACKTAFTTPHGHFKFNRMPFELKNVSASFQRLMDVVLTGLQGFVVIYASSIENHERKLENVFNYNATII